MTVTKKELQRGITSYTVSNGTVSFTAMNYGCSIMQILVPNKLGMLTDIVQGYDTLEGWKADTDSHNCIVGRFANRIAGAKFELDGTTYTLDANDGENCLHGGFTRWEKMVWDSESFTEDDCAGVRFSRISPDGEQGFPGNLTVTVTYALNTKNELSLTYTATTDAATPVNLTNHAYFNLTGGGSILDHVVQLEGSDWFGEDDAPVRINGLPLEAKTTAPLEVYGGLIPTGKRDKNHVFDFRSPRPLSDGISGSEIPAFIGGYDHCFVTPAKDESSVVHTGAVWSPLSGIKMDISTNQSGMQIYSGNFLQGAVGKGGAVYGKHTAVCFETQRFPDAPNQPDFPSCILRPGETYKHQTILAFSNLA